MPVARNTWQPSLTLKPALAVRRRTIGVDADHRNLGEPAGFAERRAEEGGLAVLADAGHGETLIEELFELVMRRHFVALAAFLVKAHPPALAARVIVLDPHGNDGC